MTSTIFIFDYSSGNIRKPDKITRFTWCANEKGKCACKLLWIMNLVSWLISCTTAARSFMSGCHTLRHSAKAGHVGIKWRVSRRILCLKSDFSFSSGQDLFNGRTVCVCFDPLVRNAACRTNGGYSISKVRRLARMLIRNAATTRNTALTIQATGVE